MYLIQTRNLNPIELLPWQQPYRQVTLINNLEKATISKKSSYTISVSVYHSLPSAFLLWLVWATLKYKAHCFLCCACFPGSIFWCEQSHGASPWGAVLVSICIACKIYKSIRLTKLFQGFKVKYFVETWMIVKFFWWLKNFTSFWNENGKYSLIYHWALECYLTLFPLSPSYLNY
jgi:hypothetical protein